MKGKTAKYSNATVAICQIFSITEIFLILPKLLIFQLEIGTWEEIGWLTEPAAKLGGLKRCTFM